MSKFIISLPGLPHFRDLGHAIRSKAAEVIGATLDSELDAALGGARYERSGTRCGRRNGSTERTITTGVGAVKIATPRGRLLDDEGNSREFQSAVLPRYARRTEEVNEAILGAYFGGGNTRRIKRMLSPLLGESNLSKSAVSRLLRRVKDLFTEWSHRDLSGEWYPIVYLDATMLKVRLVRRVVNVPILVALGVTPEGEKRVIAMSTATGESGESWGAFVRDLLDRGLESPVLVISDGHAGLKKAMEAWPDVDVQRCTIHKLRNLLRCCPSHAHAELKRDYHAIIRARDGLAAREAYTDMLKKWKPLCPAVCRSLEEAGLQLVAFYSYPKPMWKSLRSTNAIENLNREFRRRTKTQGSFSTEDAALSTLFGLLVTGHVAMRKITGYKHVNEIGGEANRCQRAA